MTRDAVMGLTLGQRVLAIARMAALSHEAQLQREECETTRRQVTGGAGSTCSRDGVPPTSTFSAEAWVGEASAERESWEGPEAEGGRA